MYYILLHSWQRQEKDFGYVLNINHLLTDSIPPYMISETHLTLVPASPWWFLHLVAQATFHGSCLSHPSTSLLTNITLVCNFTHTMVPVIISVKTFPLTSTNC